MQLMAFVFRPTSFFCLTLALMMCMQATVKSSTQRIFRHLLKSITCTWKPFLKSKANKCCSKFVRGSPQKSRFCMHKKKSKQDCSTTVKSICIGTQWRNYMTTRTYIYFIFIFIYSTYLIFMQTAGIPSNSLGYGLCFKTELQYF